MLVGMLFCFMQVEVCNSQQSTMWQVPTKVSSSLQQELVHQFGFVSSFSASEAREKEPKFEKTVKQTTQFSISSLQHCMFRKK